MPSRPMSLYRSSYKHRAKLQLAFEEPVLRDGGTDSEPQRILFQSGTAAAMRIFDSRINNLRESGAIEEFVRITDND